MEARLMQDQIQRFILNNGEYRGVLVHLTDSYKEILSFHAYPKPIAELLGEALAAVALLGNNLKHPGRLIFQIETDDAVELLATEINENHGIRGVIQWRDEVPLTQPLITSGQCAITLIPEQGERYQGIVPITHAKIEKSLEYYFHQSEQIYSRIVLACNGDKAAALLIQKLPTKDAPTLDETTLNFLVDTIKPHELLIDDNQTLLRKVFHEYDVELYTAESVAFECTCTPERMQNAIRILGKADALALFSTQKTIEVTCEYCNDQYNFDKADVERIFSV